MGGEVRLDGERLYMTLHPPYCNSDSLVRVGFGSLRRNHSGVLLLGKGGQTACGVPTSPEPMANKKGQARLRRVAPSIQ